MKCASYRVTKRPLFRTLKLYPVDIQRNLGKKVKRGRSETDIIYIYLSDANSVNKRCPLFRIPEYVHPNQLADFSYGESCSIALDKSGLYSTWEKLFCTDVFSLNGFIVSESFVVKTHTQHCLQTLIHLASICSCVACCYGPLATNSLSRVICLRCCR